MCFADCEASDLGAVLGRLSNGIAGSSFVLNGVVYNISDSTDHWDKVLYAVHCILFKSSHVFAVCIIFTLSTQHSRLKTHLFRKLHDGLVAFTGLLSLIVFWISFAH